MKAFISLLSKTSKFGVRYSCGCIHVNDVYILSAVRTPIGCFQGKLSSLTAVQLATKALIGAIDKGCVVKEDIEEVILGNTFQAGLGQAPAHQVALSAGLPSSVVTSSVNKMCASGMKAISLGCQVVISHNAEVVAVGGMESLTHVPYILRRKKLTQGNLCVPDLIFSDGLHDMYDQRPILCFAEETAKEYEITRNDQDAFAVESYTRALKAQEAGIFGQEIIPVRTLRTDGEEDDIVFEDEQLRRMDVKKITQLPTILGKDGTITRGNSPGFHDGAAMLVLASGNYILKKRLTPMARIVSFADYSLCPSKFCLSPSVVIPKVLLWANVTVEDICMWEINETYAITSIVNMKLLKLNHDIVNMHGGSISLGHPFGMSGARLVVHLAHALQSGAFGCACISHAGGGGSAMVIEKL